VQRIYLLKRVKDKNGGGGQKCIFFLIITAQSSSISLPQKKKMYIAHCLSMQQPILQQLHNSIGNQANNYATRGISEASQMGKHHTTITNVKDWT
jgi:hypothetical protein